MHTNARAIKNSCYNMLMVNFQIYTRKIFMYNLCLYINISHVSMIL